jgi:hypothetical protein
MVLADLIREARALPADERLELIGELWDNSDPDFLPASDAEVCLVQERARRLEAHPEDEIGWAALEAEVDSHLA